MFAVLAVYFNEPDVGNEGALLTWVSVALLLGTALVAGFRCATVESREKLFWLIISLGFVYLALDDAFQVHEGVDNTPHRLPQITKTDPTDHIDDAIIAFYGIFLAGLLWYFKDIVPKHRAKVYPLSIAILFFSITVILDFVHTDYSWDNRYFEEGAKVLSVYFFLLTVSTRP